MRDELSELDRVLGAELVELAHSGQLRSLRTIERKSATTLVVDGREVLDFASDNFLGLATDPRVAAAATAALAQQRTGAAGTRLASGNAALHGELEREIAQYRRAEAALLFPNSYLTNVGALPALASSEDVIYTDAQVNASLTDAAAMSGATVRSFRHDDREALEQMLAIDRASFRRKWIVVDSILSTDGDPFPLDELVALARGAGAFTYVDDSNGIGVIGAEGRGAAEHYNVERRVDVVSGSLGKSFGVAGGFVSGSTVLIRYLINKARPFVFSTATPPALAAAVIEAIRIIEAEPWRRKRLQENARALVAGLKEMGFATPPEPAGHIVSLPVGDSFAVATAADVLRDRGFLVGALRPPVVPAASARVRISVSAAHHPDQIEDLLEAIELVLRPRGLRLGVRPAPPPAPDRDVLDERPDVYVKRQAVRE
jgi:8-amino-7-oxononanoate synthase